MKFNLKLTPFVWLIFFTACATKPITNKTEHSFLKYERTSCSGACPVFITEFFDNGQVIIRVEENFLNGPGTYEAILSGSEIAEIKEKFKSSGFNTFEDEYESNMKDLPTTFIFFSSGQEEKKIKIYGTTAPEELEKIKDELFDTIKQLEWARVISTD